MPESSSHRHLVIDPIGGIAGDMLCAALIDLDAKLNPQDHSLHLEQWKEVLRGLNLEHTLISTSKVLRGGFHAHHVKMCLDQMDAVVSSTHHHRHLADVEKIIKSSRADDKCKRIALRVFRELAIAEAAVHGQSIDEVHFHEVGAVDSILDILGASWWLAHFSIESIDCHSVPVGVGTINSQHGLLPLPAPATAILLRGQRIRTENVPLERCTPTGAAFLASLPRCERPDGCLLGSGFGAGSRDPKAFANILRVMLIEAQSTSTHNAETNIWALKCTLDDCSPEYIAPLFELLLENGALDVTQTSVMMKKNRMGSIIEVLTPATHISSITELLLRNTTTFGVRRQPYSRTVLERSYRILNTKIGIARIKQGWLEGMLLKESLEYEDVLSLAKQNGLTLLETRNFLTTEMHLSSELHNDANHKHKNETIK